MPAGLGVTRRALAVVAVAALLGGVAACGSDQSSGSDDQVTLRFDWWGNPDRATVTEKAIDLFTQKHPNIKIETSYAEFNAYFQKLATQIAGGSAPDVLQMDYRYVREYADRGVLQQLDTGPAKLDTSGINQALLTGGTINGKLYGIPVAQNTQQFTYDPAQWTAAGATAPTAGWTWDNLLQASKKVSDATKNKVRGVVDFGPIEDWFEVWLRQQGKQLYTQDGKLGYTADDVTRYWQLTDGFRRSGAATQAELTAKVDGSQANDPVTQKKSSSGFGYDSGLTAKSWEIMGREMALSVFPSDTGKIGQYAKPSMLFSVSKKSSHPAQAAEFLNFLINDAEAGKILGMSRGLPANTQVRETVATTLTGPPKVGYDFEKAVASQLDQAPPPPPKGAGTVKSTFQRVYDDVMFGRATPKDAATRFMSQANQALGS
jgi:multiple sugar transport system substrate-binding protein